MSDGSTEHRWDDDLPAYALGALDDAGSAELERHLAGCSRCQERLRWLQGAIDVLPASVEQLDPPPRLRRNLMATVHEEAVAARGGRRTWWRAGGRVSFRTRPATALVAVGLVVAGVAGFAIAAAVRESPSNQIVAQATPAGAGASAVLDPQGEGMGFHAASLPALSRGDVYELWTQVGDTVQPAGTFRVAADGSGYAWIATLPDGTSEILLTREPHGGSDAPTGPVLLQAAV